MVRRGPSGPFLLPAFSTKAGEAGGKQQKAQSSGFSFTFGMDSARKHRFSAGAMGRDGSRGLHFENALWMCPCFSGGRSGNRFASVGASPACSVSRVRRPSFRCPAGKTHGQHKAQRVRQSHGPMGRVEIDRLFVQRTDDHHRGPNRDWSSRTARPATPPTNRKGSAPPPSLSRPSLSPSRPFAQYEHGIGLPAHVLTGLVLR